ncbi:MAG: hypothetical protein AABY51_10045 [Deltaproteobacteria bacterium]
MSEDKTAGECWQYNQDTRSHVEKLEERHDKLAERVFQKLDALEDKLVSRLPVWATMFISLLMLLVGALFARAVLN